MPQVPHEGNGTRDYSGLCSRADKDFVLTGCLPCLPGTPQLPAHQAIEGKRSGLGSGRVLQPASDTLPPPPHILHVPVCASRSFSPLHTGWVQGWHRSRSRSRLFPPSRNPVSSRREFCSLLHPQMGLQPGNQCRSTHGRWTSRVWLSRDVVPSCHQTVDFLPACNQSFVYN